MILVNKEIFVRCAYLLENLGHFEQAKEIFLHIVIVKDIAFGLKSSIVILPTVGKAENHIDIFLHLGKDHWAAVDIGAPAYKFLNVNIECGTSDACALRTEIDEPSHIALADLTEQRLGLVNPFIVGRTGFLVLRIDRPCVNYAVEGIRKDRLRWKWSIVRDHKTPEEIARRGLARREIRHLIIRRERHDGLKVIHPEVIAEVSPRVRHIELTGEMMQEAEFRIFWQVSHRLSHIGSMVLLVHDIELGRQTQENQNFLMS